MSVSVTMATESSSDYPCPGQQQPDLREFNDTQWLAEFMQSSEAVLMSPASTPLLLYVIFIHLCWTHTITTTTVSIINKDQSDFVKGGIALASSPKSTFLFARWQQRFAIACFGCVVWRPPPQKKSSLPWGLPAQGPPSNTVRHWTHQCTCQMASKSVERFKQGARHWS